MSLDSDESRRSEWSPCDLCRANAAFSFSERLFVFGGQRLATVNNSSVHTEVSGLPGRALKIWEVNSDDSRLHLLFWAGQAAHYVKLLKVNNGCAYVPVFLLEADGQKQESTQIMDVFNELACKNPLYLNYENQVQAFTTGENISQVKENP